MVRTSNAGVVNSSWVLYDEDNNDINNIVNIYGINKVLAKILYNRNINLKDIANILNPKIKQEMPDPFVLQDMKKACDIIYFHMKNNSKIMIFGDYDADGITSVAMITKYLCKYCNNIIPHIPNRYKHGYGLNMVSINDVIDKKPDLLILLDNGTSSIDEVAQLKKLNCNIVIIDHHSVDSKTPNADAFINPKRMDNSDCGLDFLCTGGLVFMLLVALNRKLEEEKFFNDNRSKINIMEFLDLVAISTICDMVPLVGLNRAFVMQGIKVMQKRLNPSLSILYDKLGINKPIDYEAIGYSLGPIINCGGRMSRETLPLELLLNDDKGLCGEIVDKLLDLNKQRQEVEEQSLQWCIDKISNNYDDNQSFIFEGDENFLSGVVGIVAGRIKESYNKPTCIFSINKETGICVASGRSVEGLDLGNIILSAKSKGLLLKGGGHSQAVGFSFDIAKFGELKEFLIKKINYSLSKKLDVEKTLLLDALIPIYGINKDLTDNITKLQPFGMGFKEPVFLISNIKLQDVKTIGKNKNHLQMFVSDGLKFKVKALCYKSVSTKLGDFLLQNENSFINIAVNVKSNFYQGKNYVNLIVVDAAPNLL